MPAAEEYARAFCHRAQPAWVAAASQRGDAAEVIDGSHLPKGTFPGAALHFSEQDSFAALEHLWLIVAGDWRFLASQTQQ